MSFNWLANFYIRHSYGIIFTISFISGTGIILPFVFKDLPDFNNPQLGYQTRGTPMANKLTTWYNLIQETKEYGVLTINPAEYLYRENISINFTYNDEFKNEGKDDKIYGKVLNSPKNRKMTRSAYNGTFQDPSWFQLRLFFVGNEKPTIGDKEWDRLSNSGYFCGSPHADYSHVVVESSTGNDLFTLESLQQICRMQESLTDNQQFKDLCVINVRSKICCRCWSIPNYIALLNHKESCHDITLNDVESTKELLKNCSHYFHSARLNADCSEDNEACRLPGYCSRENAVFSILNYLTDISFLPPNDTKAVKLRQTIIFIPIAISSATLDYYQEIVEETPNFNGISIVASEFGLKNIIFEQYLVKDSWLFCLGGIFVLFCVWFYTESIFLTLMTIIGFLYSLGISYFLYAIVFKLEYFPFMNMLIIVIALGVGTDDAFVMCSTWRMMKDSLNGPIVKLTAATLEHSIISITITSFTTAAAFASSYVSSITAIKCFSLFASITIIVNCIIMTSWFPSCMVIWERNFRSDQQNSVLKAIINRLKCPCMNWQRFSRRISRYIPNWLKSHETTLTNIVITYRHFWFTLFSLIAVGSGVVVFYYPRLQLPNSNELQLLENSHPFEQYEMYYSHKFWFIRSLRENQAINLPLRFIWGLIPQDNGNHLEPLSYGKLKFDENFNMSHPDSQVWLLNFCKSLRKQPFYGLNYGLLLSNCFIETFKKWMTRSCYDEMENVNHSPCCESESFPFRSWVFDQCIIDAISYLHKTPPAYYAYGFAGPRFSKELEPTVTAIVIEYQSNYTFSLSYEYMDQFVKEVENWFSNELKSAPETMRGGFFVSETDFYDLQTNLSVATLTAILASLLLSLSVLYLTTLNIIISVFAILSITCNILVTMSLLILIKWKLNIIESIAISSAIGLAIDFTLHYTVSYKLSSVNLTERQHIVRQALTKIQKPVMMSALTTAAVGTFMLPSQVMAYIQIGTFLVIVIIVSWVYSTFHLCSLLALAGPERNFGQLVCKKEDKKRTAITHTDPDKADDHELVLLADKPTTSNVGPPSTCSEQSPSGASVISTKITYEN